MTKLARAVLAASLIASPAWAQEDPPIDPEALEGDSFTIGAGVGVVPSYEGSDDYVFAVMPLVRGRVSRINFSVRGNRAWADVIPTPGGPGWDVQFGPVAQVNLNRSAAIVDPQVKLLPKRDTAIELGGFAGIARQGVITSDYDKLGVTVAYVHDVAGTHGSYVLTPSVDYSTPLSTKAFVGINFSADYMGGGYADTYFSIDAPGSAASGLPVFAAGSGWKDWTLSTYAAVSLTGDLTHGLSLIAAASYRRLLEDAAASPITSVAGSPSQWVGGVGLAYSF